MTFEEWCNAIDNSNDGFELHSIAYRLLNLYEELRRRSDPKYKTGSGFRE